jgi:hypothetical protein
VDANRGGPEKGEFVDDTTLDWGAGVAALGVGIEVGVWVGSSGKAGICLIGVGAVCTLLVIALGASISMYPFAFPSRLLETYSPSTASTLL